MAARCVSLSDLKERNVAFYKHTCSLPSKSTEILLNEIESILLGEGTVPKKFQVILFTHSQFCLRTLVLAAL